MKHLSYLLIAALLGFAGLAQAGDVDPAKLSKKKQTPQGLYLTATEAYRVVTNESDKVLFVDVRTPAELEFVGAPKEIDANIPYMLNDFAEFDEKKGRYNKVPNSNFTVVIAEELEKKALGKNDKIVLMCRSGSRSAKAANLLYQAGYNNVYSVIEGFEGDKTKIGSKKGQRVVNGWKNAGLPWSYKLNKDKMHIEL